MRINLLNFKVKGQGHCQMLGCQLMLLSLLPLLYLYSFIFTGSLNLDGLGEINWDELFSLPKHYWQDDMRESIRFLEDQVGCDVPQVIWDELKAQEKRIDQEL